MEAHEELRPYLFAIAYRMLGSVADAEDIVQEAFLRYQAAGRRPGVAEGVPRDDHHTARDRPTAFRPGAAGGVPRRVAAGAAGRRRRPPARRDGRFALARVPAPAREALAGRAGGVPPARGLRLPVRGRRPDRRQVARELAPDPRPRPRAYRRGPEAVRGLARGARGGRATLHRSLGDGRYRGAGRGARARRDALRRRRWEGSGYPRAACRRSARRKGAHRLAPR